MRIAHRTGDSTVRTKAFVRSRGFSKKTKKLFNKRGNNNEERKEEQGLGRLEELSGNKLPDRANTPAGGALEHPKRKRAAKIGKAKNRGESVLMANEKVCKGLADRRGGLLGRC